MEVRINTKIQKRGSRKASLTVAVDRKLAALASLPERQLMIVVKRHRSLHDLHIIIHFTN